MRVGKCQLCPREFPAAATGAIPRYCPDCRPKVERARQRIRDARRAARAEGWTIQVERKREEDPPVVEETVVSHGPLCGCGRDYLTVPLTGPGAACPRPVSREAAKRLRADSAERVAAGILMREGLGNVRIAEILKVSEAAVAKWRARDPGAPAARS